MVVSSCMPPAKKVNVVAQELARGPLVQDPARARLLETRKAVVAGWLATARQLEAQGECALAGEVRSFVRQMPPVMTDRERIAEALLKTLNVKGRDPRPRSKARDEERTR